MVDHHLAVSNFINMNKVVEPFSLALRLIAAQIPVRGFSGDGVGSSGSTETIYRLPIL